MRAHREKLVGKFRPDPYARNWAEGAARPLPPRRLFDQRNKEPELVRRNWASQNGSPKNCLRTPSDFESLRFARHYCSVRWRGSHPKHAGGQPNREDMRVGKSTTARARTALLEEVEKFLDGLFSNKHAYEYKN